MIGDRARGSLSLPDCLLLLCQVFSSACFAAATTTIQPGFSHITLLLYKNYQIYHNDKDLIFFLFYYLKTSFISSTRFAPGSHQRLIKNKYLKIHLI